MTRVQGEVFGNNANTNMIDNTVTVTTIATLLNSTSTNDHDEINNNSKNTLLMILLVLMIRVSSKGGQHVQAKRD